MLIVAWASCLARYEVAAGDNRLVVDDTHQRGSELLDPGACVESWLGGSHVVFVDDRWPPNPLSFPVAALDSRHPAVASDPQAAVFAPG